MEKEFKCHVLKNQYVGFFLLRSVFELLTKIAEIKSQKLRSWYPCIEEKRGLLLMQQNLVENFEKSKLRFQEMQIRFPFVKCSAVETASFQVLSKAKPTGCRSERAQKVRTILFGTEKHI